jgi:hypothetical protein
LSRNITVSVRVVARDGGGVCRDGDEGEDGREEEEGGVKIREHDDGIEGIGGISEVISEMR